MGDDACIVDVAVFSHELEIVRVLTRSVHYVALRALEVESPTKASQIFGCVSNPTRVHVRAFVYEHLYVSTECLDTYSR